MGPVLGKACSWNYKVKRKAQDPAVILYSGGTTGKTKGIVLSNINFNALSQQVIAANPMFKPGDKMLAAMPLFHGFGLGVCIHTMLSQGGRCILVPRFTAKSYAKLITKYKCNFIAFTRLCFAYRQWKRPIYPVSREYSQAEIRFLLSSRKNATASSITATP